MGNGYVLKEDVEAACALLELAPDLGRDKLALGDELGSVEAGDDGLGDLIDDGGKDALVVVCAKPARGGEGGASAERFGAVKGNMV